LNPKEDFQKLKVARRDLSINKMDQVGMVDMEDMVDSVDKDMMKIQRDFGYI
jgi:hypothetical protein